MFFSRLTEVIYDLYIFDFRFIYDLDIFDFRFIYD